MPDMQRRKQTGWFRDLYHLLKLRKPDLAHELGITLTSVNRYLAGTRQPCGSVRRLIERLADDRGTEWEEDG